MRIVVAGGTGLLGRAFVSRARELGHELVLLSRGPGRAESPGTTVVSWTPDGTVDTWARSVEGAGLVVNLAGEPLAGGRWNASRKRRIRESRVLSTRSLAMAIAAHTSPRPALLSASGTGYYGARGDEVVTEDDGPGDDFLAQTCVAWEAAADPARQAGARVVHLRSGVVLTADGGALPQLARPFKLFVGGPVASGRQYLPWIHRDDWVRLTAWLAFDTSAQGAFNLTAPAPVTNGELATTLAAVLHRPALFRVPAFALRAGVGELADTIITGQRVVPRRALDAGFRFRYERLEDALREIYGTDDQSAARE